MFDKYKNGAWQEPENTVQRYANGAWQEAEASYRNINGAWEEVWSAIDVMYVYSCSLTNGTIEIANKKRSFCFDRFEDKEQQYGSLSGGGSIVFAIDGNWTNPKFTFDWNGGLNYCNNTYSQFFQGIMGTISISYKNASGSVITSGNVINVGGQYTDSSGWALSYGSSSTTLSGTISQIRITFSPKDLTSTYWNGGMECEIYNVKIDGEQIGFTPDAESYSKSISDY